MSESFDITFQGVDSVIGIIGGITSSIESLASNSVTPSVDDTFPELVITSSGIESELQDFLEDVHDKIQTQATTTESDFDEAL